MTGAPHALLQSLVERGVRFHVRNERLVVDAPVGALSNDDLLALKAQKSAVVALLARQATSPVRRLVCFACKERHFWRSIYGVTVCGLCHPPASPKLVAEWLDAEAPNG